MISRRIKVAILALIFLVVTSVVTPRAVLLAKVSTTASAMVTMDVRTGRVLYTHNGDVKRPMASTTKIMTAVVAIESMALDTKISIPRQAVGIEGSSIYLCEGEILTLEELLYALLLSSANDAAVAIAISVGKSVERFAEMMNDMAISVPDSKVPNIKAVNQKQHGMCAAISIVRKKLAYEVQNFRDGFFTTTVLTIPADKIAEFKRQLRLNDSVLRTMFIEVAAKASV